MFSASLIRRTMAALAMAGTVTAALLTGAASGAQASPVSGVREYDEPRSVNQVTGRRDWCSITGCAEHQETTATLVIVTRITEDDETGETSGKPIRAYIAATTTTWTDLKLAGFRATTQVRIGPDSFETDVHRFGVDGQWIPSSVGSRRVDHWSANVPLPFALKAQRGKGWMAVGFVRD